MKQNKLPKWNERTLFEKIFTCLVAVFGILAITFIILETAEVNVPNRLDSMFISLELLCIGILSYRYNKPLATILIIICVLSLVRTIINML